MAKRVKKSKHGHYVVKGVAGTFPNIEAALDAALLKRVQVHADGSFTMPSYRRISFVCNDPAMMPVKGETWAAGPIPMYAPVTILRFDGMGNVHYSAVNPLGKVMQFYGNVDAFLDTYKRVK